MNQSVAGTPADRTVRFINLELGGQEYSLIFDFNAIARAEKETGLNLLEAFNPEGMTATQFRAMLYASLLKAHPDITLEAAGDLVSLGGILRISKALGEAWSNSLAPPQENPPLPEQRPADS